MYHLTNISEVALDKLCTSCGACSVACPNHCISYNETVGGHIFPDVNNNICTNCGICLSICPGINFGKTLKEKLPADPFIGNVISSHVGKSVDEEIFKNSQSGGIATTIALHMLETKQADAIITVIMEWGNPPRARAHLARTREELILAQKSKYSPVPILQIISDLEKNNIRKLVVIGTSCQIHGLFNLCDILPNLREKIILSIGLFCTHVMTCTAIDHLIHETNIDNNLPKHLQFKDKLCGGYPGDVHIRWSDNCSISLPENKRHSIKNYYIPARCWLCFDELNVYSDIAIGDPWGLDDIDRIGGESVFVSRTNGGQKIIQQIFDEKKVIARAVNYDDIVKGQSVEKRRKEWYDHIATWKSMDGRIPNFLKEIMKSKEGHPKKLYLNKFNHILSLDNYSSRSQIIIDITDKIRQDEKKYNKKQFVRIICWLKKNMKKIQLIIKKFQNNNITKHKNNTMNLINPSQQSKQILTFGASVNNNFGGPSILFGFERAVHQKYPEYKIIHYQEDFPNNISIDGLDVDVKKTNEPLKLIVGALLFRIFNKSFGGKKVDKQLFDIQQSEYVVDLWGIEYCDALSKFSNKDSVFRKLVIFIGYFLRYPITVSAKILKVPVFKNSSSFGPILTSTTKFYARLFLNSFTERINAREQQSKEALEKIGIKSKKIDVFPDTGLNMKYQTVVTGDGKKPIGISVSHQIIKQWKSDESYIDCIVFLINSMLNRLDRDIWLFPNEIQKKRINDDDVSIANKIQQHINSTRIKIIDPTIISASTFKGKIASCEIMVASRYHSCVASLSSNVPLLVIGWHYKYNELLSLYNQKYMLSEANCSRSSLTSLFFQFWEERDEIRDELVKSNSKVIKLVSQSIVRLIK